MLIASHFDGRIRIRDQQLTNKGVAQAMSEALSALPGVGQVTVNERVGSLLVIYSAAVTKLQSIMERISELLGEASPLPLGAPSGKEDGCGSGLRLPALRLPDKKAAVNLGMLATLVTSMLGIIFGLKKLHVAAGILFLAVFGIHIFERRRAMFA
jgi:hypothetical protein